MDVPEDSLARLRKWMSREGPEPNRTKESTVMDDLTEFFLEELKAAKRFTLEEDVMMDEPEVAGYGLRDRGLFDVNMRKKEDNSKSFTVLQVVDPGYRFIEDVRSPYWIGYDYYVQGQKHKELEEEFRKHLPSFRHLFVEAFRVSTDSTIYMINAYFADGSFPEAFETLAARFLAAFFRILEDKS